VRNPETARRSAAFSLSVPGREPDLSLTVAFYRGRMDCSKRNRRTSLYYALMGSACVSLIALLITNLVLD
jgi:hypothetical protein